ncbi:MAG TPA: isoprenylcysteine carboxylmethyltransferase family protein [Candidatus Acidoferrum sp.]
MSLLWQILYWTWATSEVIVGVATRTKRSSGNVRDRGSLLLLWIVIVASLTVCWWIGRDSPHNMFGDAPWLMITALLVMITGLVIRWTAIFTLGKSFSSNVAIQASQILNRTGLYRFIRHPSYLGLLLVFVATGLHSRNWLGFAVAVIPTTAAVLYRIHIEEAALTAAFGPAYLQYSRESKRLLPGLY